MAERISSVDDVGRLIRGRRKELGMGQEELALVSGVAQSNLSRIERGLLSMSLETALRLFDALGIDLVAVGR